MDLTNRALPHLIRFTTAVLIAGTLLGGCALSGPKESALPTDGPTMVQIYNKHMQGLTDGSEAEVREHLPMRPAADPAPGEIKRAYINGIENRFPRLPNPDLVMYVLPHLAKGKYPIPGYATAFPMYESVEYAMPGEVPPHAGKEE